MTFVTGHQLAEQRRVAEGRWQELYDETNGSPLALVHTLGLMRVRAALTFAGALEMLRGNRDADLQKFIFQEARKELTTNDKTALGALSFFVPPATLKAWIQVANLSRNALETTIDRLSALSLVDVLAGEERYTLHPLTRAFVRDELLADANVARETGMQFVRYWVDYARQYGWYNYKKYDRLEAEWANLDMVSNWLWEAAAVKGDTVEYKDAVLMLNDLADALREFIWFGGRWDECVQLNARAYDAAIALKDWSTAGWRAHDVAWIHFNCGRKREYSLWVERCTKAWARGGSRLEHAFASRMIGLVARQREDYHAAEQLLQESLTTFRELGNDIWIAIALNSLGGIARARKDYTAAKKYYLEAMELDEKSGNKEGTANRCTNLGWVALYQEQFSEAHNRFEQAIPLAHKVGRQDMVAEAQYGLARVEEAEGRVGLALPLAQEALKINERLQSKDLAAVRELVERLERGLKDEG